MNETTSPKTDFPDGGERIAKVLARAGICSRRDAERLIEDGKVKVNGRVLDTPAFKVTALDEIVVGDRVVPAQEPTRLWKYHKPTGLVTTHKDPEGRTTVFQSLPKDMPRVVSIGRLDLNSEGLLLLTNDGALARHLELPHTGWVRRYRVRVFGKLAQSDLDRLTEGVSIDGKKLSADEATLERQQGGNAWVRISLREGKNREVRRMMEALGCVVNRLIRVSYGPFQLGKLKQGDVEVISTRILRDQLGAKQKEFNLPKDGVQRDATSGKPASKGKPKARPPQRTQGRKSTDTNDRPSKPRGGAPKGRSPKKNRKDR